MLTIDRHAYAAQIGEPEELLEPLPQIAPACGVIRLYDFKLALPCGDGTHSATFFINENHVIVDGAFVRYGERSPELLPMRGGGHWVSAGDELMIRLFQR